jgi:hypothetical protein
MAAIRTAKGGRNGALSRMQGFRGSNRIPSLTFQPFAGRRFVYCTGSLIIACGSSMIASQVSAARWSSARAERERRFAP